MKSELSRKHAITLQPKKAGKKQAPGKPKGKGKDLRRAYEHLARASVLEAASQPDAELQAVARRLRELALKALDGDAALPHDARTAAEFARAAEHAGFASLVGHVQSAIGGSEELEEALRHEYNKLADEAHTAAPKKAGKSRGIAAADVELLDLSRTLITQAEAALEQEQYARAMECIRGAEALASALDHLKHAK